MHTGSRLWFCKIMPEDACDSLILVYFPYSQWDVGERTSNNHRKGNSEESFSEKGSEKPLKDLENHQRIHICRKNWLKWHRSARVFSSVFFHQKLQRSFDTGIKLCGVRRCCSLPSPCQRHWKKYHTKNRYRGDTAKQSANIGWINLASMSLSELEENSKIPKFQNLGHGGNYSWTKLLFKISCHSPFKFSLAALLTWPVAALAAYGMGLYTGTSEIRDSSAYIGLKMLEFTWVKNSVLNGFWQIKKEHNDRLRSAVFRHLHSTAKTVVAFYVAFYTTHCYENSKHVFPKQIFITLCGLFTFISTSVVSWNKYS